MAATGWKNRFWLIQASDGFFYIYDYLGMEVFYPPHFPQAAEASALFPMLDDLRRKHKDTPGPPYLLDLRSYGRSMTADEVPDDDGSGE